MMVAWWSHERGGGHVGPSLRCVEALLLLLGPPSPLQLFPSPAIPCLFVSPLGPPPGIPRSPCVRG